MRKTKDEDGVEVLGAGEPSDAIRNAYGRKHLWIDIAHILGESAYYHLVAKVSDSCARPANEQAELALSKALRRDLHRAIAEVLAVHGIQLTLETRACDG